MTDIDYNDLFGLEAEDSGTDEAESVGQTESTTADGSYTSAHDGEGEGAEPIAPAYDDDEIEDDIPDDSENDGTDTDVGESTGTENADNDAPVERTPSDRESDAVSAARREAQAQLEAERARHKGEMDALVKSLGLKDANGRPIESREALDTFNRTQRTDEARSRLRRAGVDVDALEALVSENPEVKAARAVVAEAEREKARAAEARQRAAFDEEIRKVGEIDPTVKSVDDLRAKPYFNDVYGMVERGYSISDAVRLATYDERIHRVAEGSAKSAAAKAASKSHLVPTSSRGQGAVTVPAEVRNQYRLFYPDASDAEIQRMFNDDQKRMKK